MLWPILEQKLQHFRDLEEKLADPVIAANQVAFTKIAKEHGSLAKLIKPYQEFLIVAKSLEETQGLANGDDADMAAMAAEELPALQTQYDSLKDRIEDQLLVDPGEDFDRLIVEIRAGTGGDEAALFAGNLYEMYSRFARIKNWGLEEISYSPGEAGGFKEVV
ncbi:MAG: PCRF domain-containing protein, partial [Gemmataceae bacterium]